MRLVGGTSILLLVVTLMASHATATSEASFGKRIEEETRRFVPSCLDLDDPISCIIENGYKCLAISIEGRKNFVCIRSYSRGTAVLTISFEDSTWSSRFTWDPNLLSSARFILADSRLHHDLQLRFAYLVEERTGIENVETMTLESRVIEVGDRCRWAHYRFFPKWDGDLRTAVPDDEVIEVICHQPPNSDDWSCSVEVKIRESLLKLQLTDSVCGA